MKSISLKSKGRYILAAFLALAFFITGIGVSSATADTEAGKATLTKGAAAPATPLEYVKAYRNCVDNLNSPWGIFDCWDKYPDIYAQEQALPPVPDHVKAYVSCVEEADASSFWGVINCSKQHPQGWKDYYNDGYIEYYG